MASYKTASAFLTIPLLLLLLISHSSSSDDGHQFKVDSIDDSQKVKLSLYYEALCPYCANFITNNVSKIFEDGLISIIDLKLLPWGNAYVKDDKNWVCQHGPDECLLNTVEACAIRAWPDQGAHFSFRFINCVERLHLENKHTDWKSCFRTEGLDPKPVVDCFNSGLGFQLELSYADETALLNPPHRFVPWVVVDNLSLQEDYQNFASYVCKAYKGPVKPEACSSPLLEISSLSTPADQVCYTSDTKSIVGPKPPKASISIKNQRGPELPKASLTKKLAGPEPLKTASAKNLAVPPPKSSSTGKLSEPVPPPKASSTRKLSEPVPPPKPSSTRKLAEPVPPPKPSSTRKLSEPVPPPKVSSTRKLVGPEPPPKASSTRKLTEPVPPPKASSTSNIAGTETEPELPKASSTTQMEPETSA